MTADPPKFGFRTCECGHRYIRHLTGSMLRNSLSQARCLAEGCPCVAYREVPSDDG